MKRELAIIACIIITIFTLFSATSCRSARRSAGQDELSAFKRQTGPEAVDHAERLLASMTMEEKLGQLFFVDLWDDDGNPATTLDKALLSELEDIQPGGVVFYGANMKNPSQVRELGASVKATIRIPPFLAIDHEGGMVNRLDDSGGIKATELPPAADIGKTGNRELAYAIGLVMGRELAGLGLNMNFAPVADLASADSMIGSRSFANDPALGAAMVRSTVAGLQAAGVSSVLKHFPGHGGTTGDTHSGTVYLDRTIGELFNRELLPFAAGAGAGVDGIMSAHIILGTPGSGNVPATVSRDLLTGVIRNSFAYGGLIITDSLTMGAMTAIDRPAVEAIRAGADMLLTPGNENGARADILAALQEGTLQRQRIDESVLRILTVKLKRGLWSTPDAASIDALGSEAHAQIVSLIQRFHASGE